MFLRSIMFLRSLALIAFLLAGCSSNGGPAADLAIGGDRAAPTETSLPQPDGPRGDGSPPLADQGPPKPDLPPAALIVPDTPPASKLSFTIHSQQKVRPISPLIYGLNGASFSGRPKGLTLTRSGGNRMTAYNWENNASNAGTDWQNQNDSYLGGGNTPGEAVRPAIAAAHGAAASAIVTVPMIGHVAADKNGGGDVNQTPNYLQSRFHVSLAKKGAPFSLTPDLNDGKVYQDEMVAFFESKFPAAKTDPLRRILYSLDNEPDLWATTHPRLRGAATGSKGDPVTYAELFQRSKEYAAAIKAAAPHALVFGPASYGWQGYVDLQAAPDAGGRDFLETYLDEMKAAGAAAGKRLLDVLDLHWYPEAQGGGVRITEDNATAAVAAARLQAPRSLWDPSYVETSWITQWSKQPIRLLPRVQAKIDAHYPGTKLALTEYYYGGGDHISGGLAQADVLGILGREGVHAAALWRMGNTSHGFIWGGFELYRSHDGAGGAFGDTSIAASTNDPVGSSVYASLDAGKPDRIVIVCLNKSDAAATAGIAVTHTRLFKKAKVYRLTSAGSSPVAAADLSITLKNAFQITLPAMSASALVLLP
jgi:hypothetical protein